MVGELKDAAEVYEHGTALLSRSLSLSHLLIGNPVRTADPTHNDAKMKLAEIYEILNEPRKALELVYEGLSHLPPSRTSSL